MMLSRISYGPYHTKKKREFEVYVHPRVFHQWDLSGLLQYSCSDNAMIATDRVNVDEISVADSPSSDVRPFARTLKHISEVNKLALRLNCREWHSCLIGYMVHLLH